MLTREERAAKGAMWLAHWQGWQSSGVSMAEYARREGFDADMAYRWRRILRRTGQWADAECGCAVSVPSAAGKPKAAAKFARVTVSEAPALSASMTLRLVLGNGRRAELELIGITQLGEVLGILERSA